MTILNARNLTLSEVHQLLGLQRRFNGSFTPLLTLEPLTEQEQQELICIRNDFEPYIDSGKMSEGVVKAMTIFPLLRLAGFYHPPIQFSIEEGIAAIDIANEDTRITGRFDILAVNLAERSIVETPFWILVIEAKEGLANPWAGLPQLLTYAYKSLDQQSSVWGLVTTGLNYQFVHLQASASPTYELMPMLNLFEQIDLTQVLQVLKSICQFQLSAGHF